MAACSPWLSTLSHRCVHVKRILTTIFALFSSTKKRPRLLTGAEGGVDEENLVTVAVAVGLVVGAQRPKAEHSQ